MNNNDFRDSLQSMIPEPTDPAELFVGAKRKRTQRRVATAAVAGIAVLALAVPLPMLLQTRQQPNVAEPTSEPAPSISVTATPSGSPTPEVVPSDEPTPETSPSVKETPTTKPSAEPTNDPTQAPTSEGPSDEGTVGEDEGDGESPGPKPVVLPIPDPHAELPLPKACLDGDMMRRPVDGEAATKGAVKAWLCEDPFVYSQSSPKEPLVTDVDRIVEIWEGLPEFTGQDCQAPTEGLPFSTIVLEYEDGSTRVLELDRLDCEPSTDGTAKKQGTEKLISEATQMWRDQRKSYKDLSLPAPAGLTCPAPEYSALHADAADSVDAFACTAGPDGAPVEVPIGADLRERIVADIVNSSPVVADGGGTDGIVLVTKWGDAINLSKRIDGRGFWYDHPDQGTSRAQYLWVPSTPELEAEVEALFE